MLLRTANLGFIKDLIDHLDEAQSGDLDIHIYAQWEHGELIYYIDVKQKH